MVSVSGCVNGCAQSAVADIGLTGRLTGKHGEKQQVYQLLIGGGRGCNAKPGEPLADGLTTEEIINKIADLYGLEKN